MWSDYASSYGILPDDVNMMQHDTMRQLYASRVLLRGMSLAIRMVNSSRFPRNSSLSSDDKRVRSSPPGSIVNVGRSLAVGDSCGYESGKSLSFSEGDV